MFKDNIIEVKWNSSNKEWLIEKGYIFTKIGNFLTININDLQPSSNYKIEVICDYCGESFSRKYYRVIEGRVVTKMDACSKCRQRKKEDSFVFIYGEKHYMKNEEFVDNYKKEIQDKFGVDNVFQLDSVKEKIRNTLLDKYGVENIMQHPDVKKIALSKNSMRIDDLKLRFPDCEIIEICNEDGKGRKIVRAICKCGDVYTRDLRTFRNKIVKTRMCRKCYLASRFGEGSTNWQGGKTTKLHLARNSKEYRDWRESVLKRDSYTCQCCRDSKDKSLEAHHIENFSSNPDTRFSLDNGMTLCRDCHNPNVKGSFHDVYGTYNNTQEQLLEYISLYSHRKLNIS